MQDIGGGIRTALAQVVAEELGLKASDVTVKIGDTSFPQGPASGGSVTTNMITPPARNAAHEVAQQLLKLIAPALGADDLSFVDGKLQLGREANRSQNPEGIVIKGPLRIKRSPKDSCFKILPPVEGVFQLPEGICIQSNRHGIDGKVPPREVLGNCPFADGGFA